MNYMGPEDAATYMGVKIAFFYILRRREPDFPRPIRIGRLPKWTPADLDAFMERHRDIGPEHDVDQTYEAEARALLERCRPTTGDKP